MKKEYLSEKFRTKVGEEIKQMKKVCSIDKIAARMRDPA